MDRYLRAVELAKRHADAVDCKLCGAAHMVCYHTKLLAEMEAGKRGDYASPWGPVYTAGGLKKRIEREKILYDELLNRYAVASKAFEFLYMGGGVRGGFETRFGVANLVARIWAGAKNKRRGLR